MNQGTCSPKPGASPRGGQLDTPTSLLPEGVPETDADLLSLDGRRGGWGR